MRRQAHPHFVFAKDGFYDDIPRVHRAAREVTYHELEHVTGWRSTTVYHEPGVKRRLERLLGIRITRWDTDPAEENGVFYHGFCLAVGAKHLAHHETRFATAERLEDVHTERSALAHDP